MDADLRARWDAHHRQWDEDYLDDREREARRKAWRKRHPWLVRSGIGVAIVAYIGVLVGGVLGFASLLSGPSCRMVTVHVDQPLVKGQ